MNRNDQPSIPPIRIPEISGEDRFAGFKDWEIKTVDGLTETVLIYTLDAKRFQDTTANKSTTKFFLEVVASSLRTDEGYVSKHIMGVYMAEIFFIAHRLHSETLFQAAFKARKGIGAEMLNEELPGASQKPSDN